jgi:hypothetical protein
MDSLALNRVLIGTAEVTRAKKINFCPNYYHPGKNRSTAYFYRVRTRIRIRIASVFQEHDHDNEALTLTKTNK